jgi:glucose/arabinose dehydrogenase
MLRITFRNRVRATLVFSSFLFTITVSQAQSAPIVSYQILIDFPEGLSLPIELASPQGDATGRLFILEKAGRIRIWNGSSLLPNPFLDIASLVRNDGEQGMLSMAFHPQYQSNGYFFVYYTNHDQNIAIERYQVSSNPNQANPVATPILVIPKTMGKHNGGHLQFRVQGGINYLYFATGDGGEDPNENAQNPGSYLGKMIRINVDAAPYTPEVWAMGLRNPFRWSFDRTTGDIWIGDVGQYLKEEINFRPLGTAGANYGWPCVEGADNYSEFPASLDCGPVRATDVLPVLAYDNPADGRSVIGGYVYRGTEFPALRGYYLATDFYTGKFWLIKRVGSAWDITERADFPTHVASISEAANGELYAVSLGGNVVYKIVTPLDAPLPLHLISFSAEPMSGYNELKWITESEENMDKYIVEYSADGVTYSNVGEVLSTNDTNRKIYTYRHSTLNTTIVYYRLKMSELNGTYEYSPVISIGADTRTGVKIYPTSVTNGSVNIISSQPVERVSITNTTGLQVLSKEMNGASGYFNVSLPILQKGIYIIRVSGKDFQKTEKILIQ